MDELLLKLFSAINLDPQEQEEAKKIFYETFLYNLGTSSINALTPEQIARFKEYLMKNQGDIDHIKKWFADEYTIEKNKSEELISTTLHTTLKDMLETLSQNATENQRTALLAIIEDI